MLLALLLAPTGLCKLFLGLVPRIVALGWIIYGTARDKARRHDD